MNSQTMKPKILVVEDEIIVARDIQLQLTDLGYLPVGLANHTILIARHGKREYHIFDSAAPIRDAAGGIAHDFNNILAVILGITELVQECSAGNEVALESLNEIMKARLRARDLVRQILSSVANNPQIEKQLI